jgi:leucyl aminopeptidase
MKWAATVRDTADIQVDLEVFFIWQKKGKIGPVPTGEVGRLIRQVAETGDFKAKEEEAQLLYLPGGAEKKTRRFLAVGLGEKKNNRELMRRAGGAVAKIALKLKAQKLLLNLPSAITDEREAAECLAEGLMLGSYTFKKYQHPSEADELPGKIESVAISGKDPGKIDEGAARARRNADGVILARDLANEPGNQLTPAKFADFARKSGSKAGLAVKVLTQEQLSRLKMGGILGVSQGSSQPPRLVIMEYTVDKSGPTVMFAGKGITFDSGGISLKPSAGMEEMKFDMCGGAAVLGAMHAIGLERPEKCNVVAFIPLAENLPGPSSLKPGDIIKTYGGKSIEVVNTDAEGRLLLADALAYGIERYKPEAVIDIATLTGAMVVALGHHICGLIATDDKLAKKIEEAGRRCGEPYWRLPLADEYAKQLKSDIADIKNVGKGRDAGAIIAGAFLREFVGKVPWAHLDIAGTAWNFTEKSYIPAGPSGFGARTLIELIRNWS